jgi:hypothetical protein
MPVIKPINFNFKCQWCHKLIYDKPDYKTSCKHYPLDGDRDAKGIRIGHKFPHHKMTYSDALLMRQLRKEGKLDGSKFTYRELGEKWEVTGNFARLVCIGDCLTEEIE